MSKWLRFRSTKGWSSLRPVPRALAVDPTAAGDGLETSMRAHAPGGFRQSGGSGVRGRTARRVASYWCWFEPDAAPAQLQATIPNQRQRATPYIGVQMGLKFTTSTRASPVLDRNAKPQGSLNRPWGSTQRRRVATLDAGAQLV